ncbi:hypothetical protein SteCoe_25422 [Stentor coeruleus]|uniref:Uncharacterized protein n=1 Tax=Stentor coeruleus TaxID=5963 RepID=A0A1R2BFA7_9CILI|nr:hypothetical protein SteCoe_25422 [Stentor coeruleus]
MGCGGFKLNGKAKRIDEIDEKATNFINIIKTRFEAQCTQYSTSCFKFKMPDEPIKLLNVRLSFLKLDSKKTLSTYFTKKLEDFLKDYIQYSNAEGYLTHSLHKICIQEYNFSIGLVVIFVTILSCCKNVRILKSCPFISVDKTECELIKDWNEYAKTLSKYHEIYIKKNTYRDLSECIKKKLSKEHVNKNKLLMKRKKYLHQADGLLNKFIDEITLKENTIMSFVNNYRHLSSSLEEVSKIAIDNKITTCEKIVHCMMKKQ